MVELHAGVWRESPQASFQLKVSSGHLHFSLTAKCYPLTEHHRSYFSRKVAS